MAGRKPKSYGYTLPGGMCARTSASLGIATQASRAGLLLIWAADIGTPPRDFLRKEYHQGGEGVKSYSSFQLPASSSAAQKGKDLPRATPVLSFPSIAEMARTLTPKRLELLRLIRRHRPQSVRQLASLAERDIKNVSTDLRVLENLGLVETQEREASRQPKRLKSAFDRLDLHVYL